MIWGADQFLLRRKRLPKYDSSVNLAAMRFAPFAHLHIHSDFSLLRSAMSVEQILERAQQLRQPAIALTDHANLFGAIEFYDAAIKRGIKPILGCEMYLCDDHQARLSQGPRRPEYPQIILLARTSKGWQNLKKLVSIAYLNGFYYKPRIDRGLLKQYGDGLIALSSGWNGEIEQHLRRNDWNAAKKVALTYATIFPNHSFFLEVQRHGVSRQEFLNQQIIKLALETGLPLVATNNARFLERKDFRAFEAALCLRQNKTFNDGLDTHYTPECYLKSYDEMRELFADLPEAMENNLHIARRCNVEIQFGQYQLPDFEAPEDRDTESYFREQTSRGLSERWPGIETGNANADRKIYQQRLEYELGVIRDMGFPGYFLIVADFIQWAKKNNIPVGPGRGSGAGSLVAYCLGITDLDPIRYGLLFERFLNPERISMPDFDIDFCMDRRDEVIEYVSKKYGSDRVAQIITYGSLKARAVIRDVGRVMALPYPKVDQLAKLIPASLDITLDKALKQEPRLKKIVDEDEGIGQMFQIARKLEGLHRHAGKHAAGVVIGREPLVETAPLYRDPRDGKILVQWNMKCIEKVGLVKFDFLGLKTLTVLHLAVDLIRKHGHTNNDQLFQLRAIRMDDEDTFRLLRKGDTAAVFQLESSGMRDLIIRLKPDCFEDVVALVALFRPGPLQSGMVDDFIERKQGRGKIDYLLPQLEPILKETYGVILYQEQVMQIAQVLAGYSLGQADLLRRAMGKKNQQAMDKQRKVFIEGAAKHKVPTKKAEYIFDLMEKFAGYGFNKSHSAAYALIAYQTGFLKAHYPQAFLAATLSCDMGHSDKIQMLIEDCRSMNLKVLPPDINRSSWEFIPEGKDIRFGLGAIKGVGETATGKILACREKDGVFDSLLDLLVRVDGRTVNKRMLEAMIKAGAMDGLIPHRYAALVAIPSISEQASRRRNETSSGQSALFSSVDHASSNGTYPAVPTWGLGDKLRFEREVLGFYLTGHPLEAYLGTLHGLSDGCLKDLASWSNGARVVLAVSIGQVKYHQGHKGRMAFIHLEDLSGSAELVCFPKLLAKISEKIKSDKAMLVLATVDKSREDPTLLAEDLACLDEMLPELVESVEIHTSVMAVDEMTVKTMETMLKRYPGKAEFIFNIRLADGSMAVMRCKQGIAWNEEVENCIETLFGRASLLLRCRKWQKPVSAGRQIKKRLQHAA